MGMLWLSGPLLLSAVIYPVFERAGENQRPPSCQRNLKQIAQGVLQYLQDYDKRYPLIDVNDTGVTASNAYGWADALNPYLKSTQIFQCPSEVTTPTIATSGRFNGEPDPTAKGYTDYWYNARLNALETKEIAAPSHTLLNGDGNDSTDTANARYSLSALPSGWPPAKRHLDGANYSYADGHVKWSKPQEITSQKTQVKFSAK